MWSNILSKPIFASCVWYSDRAYYGLCVLIEGIGRRLPLQLQSCYLGQQGDVRQSVRGIYIWSPSGMEMGKLCHPHTQPMYQGCEITGGRYDFRSTQQNHCWSYVGGRHLNQAAAIAVKKLWPLSRREVSVARCVSPFMVTASACASGMPRHRDTCPDQFSFARVSRLTQADKYLWRWTLPFFSTPTIILGSVVPVPGETGWTLWLNPCLTFAGNHNTCSCIRRATHLAHSCILIDEIGGNPGY